MIRRFIGSALAVLNARHGERFAAPRTAAPDGYDANRAANNVGDVPAAELATFALEKGKPLTELVQ